MEVISVIVMFIFGNMNDTEDRLTQYVPMESLSSCMKEVRILKKDKEFQKDAFCSPALIELKNDMVVTLHSELPEGAVLFILNTKRKFQQPSKVILAGLN